MTLIPSLHWQLVLCTPAIALFGLPHGATDWHVARRIFAPRLGRSWVLAFGACYGVLMAAVALAAIKAPGLTLLAFVAVAVWHFGAEDAHALGLSRTPAAALALGLLPVLAPALVWPGQYGLVLQTLGAVSIPDPAAIRLLGAGAVALSAAASVIALAQTGSRRLGLELVAFLTLQIMPPLLAFTAYFCVMHGPRHLAALPADCRTPPWPVTLAAIVLVAATILLAAAFRHAGPDWAATQGIFWGLAALTLPHLVLSRLAQSHALLEDANG